jgi:predicted Zn-ribbon and HTH transcriptional regulator
MACCQAAAPNGPAARQPELADVFLQFRDELPALSFEQSKAVWDITSCRTEALGGHAHQCDHCGHQENLYNSCLNRHCPKCQSLNQARWLEARQADLLPVEYFHVVFTIPSELHLLFRANPKVCYGLLFSAVSETLREVALNPKHLGARIGFTAVLHTWTQTLLFHPHVHCIVPGGGLNSEGTQWKSCKSGFLLPVLVLSKVFRGKLLSKIEKALVKGTVKLSDCDPAALLQQAARKSWVVYSKEPIAGPEQVLRYLGRYTHKIAISNSRLVSINDRQITFRWRDRSDNNTPKLMTLDALEFMRRFLLHVLPKGFMRIRHYGFLANAVRKKSIAQCRKLLIVQEVNSDHEEKETDPETWQHLLERLTGIDVTRCPACKSGHLVRRGTIPAAPVKWSFPGRAAST